MLIYEGAKQFSWSNLCTLGLGMDDQGCHHHPAIFVQYWYISNCSKTQIKTLSFSLDCLNSILFICYQKAINQKLKTFTHLKCSNMLGFFWFIWPFCVYVSYQIHMWVLVIGFPGYDTGLSYMYSSIDIKDWYGLSISHSQLYSIKQQGICMAEVLINHALQTRFPLLGEHQCSQ